MEKELIRSHSSWADQSVLKSEQKLSMLFMSYIYLEHKLTFVRPKFKHVRSASWLGSNATSLFEIKNSIEHY